MPDDPEGSSEARFWRKNMSAYIVAARAGKTPRCLGRAIAMIMAGYVTPLWHGTAQHIDMYGTERDAISLLPT